MSQLTAREDRGYRQTIPGGIRHGNHKAL